MSFGGIIVYGGDGKVRAANKTEPVLGRIHRNSDIKSGYIMVDLLSADLINAAREKEVQDVKKDNCDDR